jgi:hypothetical protein
MASVDTSGSRWQQVITDFRRACLLRYEGKLSESTMVLENELPKSIASWSEETPGTPVAKREALGEMFKSEQRRVDDAVLVHRMVSKSLSTEILPTVCSMVAQEIRDAVSEQIVRAPGFGLGAEAATVEPRPTRVARGSVQRIRFDDIGSIIDSLQNEQSADYGTRPIPAFA